MKLETIKNHRFVQKVLVLFKQGLTPYEMSLSIVLGSFIGIIPLIGIATPVIAFLAIYLRLNLPIAIFMTYAVSPIHLLLFIPFIRVGEWIYGVQHSLITFTAIKQAFVANYMNAFQDLVFQLWCGVTGWLVVGMPVAVLIFYLIYTGLKYFRKV